jgi:epsilon-lactone hydrolase
MSALMTATRTLARARGHAVRRRGGQDQVRALFSRAYPEPAAVPGRMLRRFEVSRAAIAGLPVIRLKPRGRASGQHLIYTHGGAYVQALIRPHWWILDGATSGTGVTITVPLYRLAPEGNVAGAYHFLGAVYQQVTAEAGAGNVTLAGDSSGGGLALGQAIACHDSGIPEPRQVILLSPWLDITLSNPRVPALQPHDPTLDAGLLRAAGLLWAGGTDPRDPRLSPLFGGLAGLPPVHVFQGGHDIFAADAQDLAAELRRLGNTGTFTLAPAGFHVYPGAVWTTESRAALHAVRLLLGKPRP